MQQCVFWVPLLFVPRCHAHWIVPWAWRFGVTATQALSTRRTRMAGPVAIRDWRILHMCPRHCHGIIRWCTFGVPRMLLPKWGRLAKDGLGNRQWPGKGAGMAARGGEGVGFGKWACGNPIPPWPLGSTGSVHAQCRSPFSV